MGDYFDMDWLVGEMVVEVVVMLLCEKGGRYQYCYLFVVIYCQESGVYCYFCFIKVNIVVYQMIYCQWLIYVVKYCINGLSLIWCGFKWEVVVE